jgi:hypothetical protein
MPNPDDGLIAPRVLSRYRQMGVIPGWSKDRFLRLCGLANRAPEEIGVMAGLTPGQTRAAMERGVFTPPVSLHFAMIDAVFRERNFGEPGQAIVPLDLLGEP